MKTSYRVAQRLEMPYMPVAGTLAGTELLSACLDKDGGDKCPYLTIWLNKMIRFKIEYEILNRGSRAK